MSLRDVFLFREGEDDDKHAAAMRKTGFWGKQGAGCLFYALSTGRMLFPKRSDKVLEPHTWGTWGGAMDQGETPEQAVRREVGEEAGVRVKSLIPVFTFKHPSGFQYHDFLAIVPDEFEPKLDHETEDAKWVQPPDWPSPLHPGVRAMLDSRDFKAALYRIAQFSNKGSL